MPAVDTTILQPVFALAFWTACVLLLIPIARFRAGLRGQLRVNDFKYGESTSVPPHVSLPNRNFMNLLEMPVLFYVVCLVIQVTGCVSPGMLALAWAFVAARVLHSLIHLTYNRVMHRLAAFGLSNGVLIALWVLVAQRLFFA
jgi:hypothetical protein